MKRYSGPAVQRLAAPLTLALLSTLPSCRKVPADISLPHDDRPTSTAVIAEPPPKPSAPASSGLAPISAEIQELYRCWFRRPYSYMFRHRSAALEVNGNRYGMLMAGIGGILYYGNLNDCAGELTGQRTKHYADIGPIETLAGVPATLPNSRFGFETVNPEFIAYARTRLLPPPEQTIDGLSAQLAYDLVFQRFFRVMGLSLIDLLERNDIEVETKRYLAATSAGQDGIEWLENQYAGRIAIAPEGWDGTTMTAPMAFGFWLRRHADGSLAACWHGLRDVLLHYDSTWLNENLGHNGKAAAALERLADPLRGQP